MQKHQPTIGFLTADLTDSRYRDAWAGFVAVARARGANAICFPAGAPSEERLRSGKMRQVLCDLINPEMLDGLVTFQWWRDQEVFHQICDPFHNLPIVNLMRSYPGYPGVAPDSYANMRQIMQHLIVAHGYHRIAYIHGMPENPTEQVRYQAYLDALTAYGLPLAPHLMTPYVAVSAATEHSGQETIRILFQERRLKPGQDVEAIVAFNDQEALGALAELQKQGIRVPEMLAVVGFDDIYEAQLAAPPLTTIATRWYDLGRRAAEMILAALAGEAVPEQDLLSGPLVIRRSCGCVSPLIKAAAIARPQPSMPLSTAEIFPFYAQQALQALKCLEAGYGANDSNWADALLESFVTDLMGEASESAAAQGFLAAFEACLSQRGQSAADVMTFGQSIISELYRHLWPYLVNKEALTGRAENLWQQGRILVSELTQLRQKRQQAMLEQQAALVRDLSQRLISTFDVAEVITVLAENLPQLHVSSCYLSLYVNPAQPHEGARLILAYRDDQRLDIPPEGLQFQSRQFVPENVLPDARPYHLVVEPLYFHDAQLGLVVFEENPETRPVYDILRGEISNALQGALLVQRVQEHAAEVIRQKYILDTFMATVPDRIYFKDRNSRVIQANQACALRFGLHDPADMIGKSDADFFTAEEARLRNEQEQAIMRTGEPLVDVEEFDQSGHWTLTTKMPLRNEHGEMSGIFGVSRDITALKQAQQELAQYRDGLEELVVQRTAEITRINALLHQEILERGRIEEALRMGEQQYRLLAESVQYGIVILQAERLVLANAVLAGMVGYSSEHLLSCDPLALFPVDFRSTAQQRLFPVGAHVLEGTWHTELATRNGRSLWAEITCSPIIWNSLPARLLTIQNITDRKLREQRLEEERARLEQENLNLKFAIKERYRFGELVGKSPAMQRVYELISSAAAAGVNVLLAGESGTGKELIAHTLHQVSPRQSQTFVPVNCASIPETLFEREFFGHRKGAFTGADREKAGFFDLAHKGTLFLDEVTELTPGTQAKLLRVLQDGQYTPLGSPLAKQANVVVVAATNKDCRAELAAGRLRKDFFYRIGVIEINVPPLRDRKEDVPLLIEHILEQYRQKQVEMHGALPPGLPTDQTMLPGDLVQALYAYDWPGNVRELQNILQRYLATNDWATMRDLIATPETSRALAQLPLKAQEGQLADVLEVVEKQVIADTLAQVKYETKAAAQKLGLPLRTLQRRIRKYGL